VLESVITYNGLALNDQSKRSLQVAPYYWFRVTSVDGIWDEDVRFEVHDLPHRHGQKSGDAFYQGKTLVLAGTVIAKDVGYLRQAQRALQQAFYDLEPHALTFTLRGENQVYINCRKNQKIDMPEQQNDGGPAFRRQFTIQLFADDPRLYVVGSNTVYPIWS